MTLVGVVVVPLTAFMPRTIGRSEDIDIVSHLERVFNRTGCTAGVENRIKGLINQQVYELILSRIPKNDLVSTIGKESDQTLPRIDLYNCIECIDGLQRVAAARGRLEWWTVELYCIVGSKQCDEFRRSVIRRSFRNQTKYSGGDIFRLRHEFPLCGEIGVQLTKSGERCLRTLLSRGADGNLLRPLIVDALDSLTKFPGILPGLQVGNIFRILAAGCDQEIAWYIGRHIRTTWEKISDNNLDIYQFVDVETVKGLEGLAPFTEPDRATISKRFDDKEVFRHLSSAALRERVKQNVLSLNVIIPSLATFHANMRYLSICSKILWRHIAPDPPRRQPGSTLWETLGSYWKSPARPVIESGVNKSLTFVSTNKSIAYMSLYIIVFRSFPLLDSEPPLRDKRSDDPPKAGLDKIFLSYLHHRASELGFSTPKINQGIQNSIRPSLPEPEPSLEPWPCKWRSGKPTVSALRDLQQTGFIPTLLVPGTAGVITPTAVLSDLLHSFFNFRLDEVPHPTITSDQVPEPIDQTDVEGTPIPGEPNQSDNRQEHRDSGNFRPDPSRSPIPSPGLGAQYVKGRRHKANTRTINNIRRARYRQRDETKRTRDAIKKGQRARNSPTILGEPAKSSNKTPVLGEPLHDALREVDMQVPQDFSQPSTPLPEPPESPARTPLASPIEGLEDLEEL